MADKTPQQNEYGKPRTPTNPQTTIDKDEHDNRNRTKLSPDLKLLKLRKVSMMSEENLPLKEHTPLSLETNLMKRKNTVKMGKGITVIIEDEDSLKKMSPAPKSLVSSRKGTTYYPLGSTQSSRKPTMAFFSEANLSIVSQCLPMCTACGYRFPYPMNLPENHSVVPLQKTDYLFYDFVTMGAQVHEGQRRQDSTIFKSRSGITTNNVTARSEFMTLVTGNTTRNWNMSDEITMFPKARTMFIHSGNIINWNRLKRKPNQTSSEEICEIIGKTLGAYLEVEDKTQLQYVTEIYKVNSENVQKLEENEREEVKITVKLFICMSQPTSVISEVINKVLNELGTNYVETLLLAVGPRDGDDEDSSVAASLSTLQPYWEAMEELVSADKVLSLGICDLTKDELEDLYNWAKVKPSIDQVNLQSCCVMPKDLTEYAKSVNVQLLTHNDRPVLVTEEALQETVLNVSTEPDSAGWSPQWVVRYSGILKCRGIIKMKGYIVHARRGNKKLLL